MPDTEIAKMLVLSTAQLSFIDATAMESIIDLQIDFPVGIYDKPDCGFFINVPQDAGMQSVSGHHQMLPSLLKALIHARSLGCDWIMFDRDGAVTADLPSYDW